MSLKLYYEPTSPPSRAVLILITLLQIPHEKVRISFTNKDHKSPEYLAINPLGEVPCIVEADGFALWESEAIMKYLVNSRKQGGECFYPGDPKERAMVDKYYPFHHGVFKPKVSKYAHSQYKFLFPSEEFGEQETIEKELEKALKMFDEIYLQDKNFINGNEMTIADLSALSELAQNYFTNDFDFACKFPRLKEYIERCMENPVVSEVHKEMMGLRAYIQSIMAAAAAAKKQEESNGNKN